jgi:hypothetical protein
MASSDNDIRAAQFPSGVHVLFSTPPAETVEPRAAAFYASDAPRVKVHEHVSIIPPTHECPFIGVDVTDLIFVEVLDSGVTPAMILQQVSATLVAAGVVKHVSRVGACYAAFRIYDGLFVMAFDITDNND